MSNHVHHISPGEFPKAIASGLTLVDFWAPWCGPCKAIAPVLEDLATEFAGKVSIAKVNVDEDPATASDFGIMSIPTLILFKDGQPVGKIVGAVPRAQIKAFMEGAA